MSPQELNETYGPRETIHVRAGLHRRDVDRHAANLERAGGNAGR